MQGARVIKLSRALHLIPHSWLRFVDMDDPDTQEVATLSAVPIDATQRDKSVDVHFLFGGCDDEPVQPISIGLCCSRMQAKCVYTRKSPPWLDAVAQLPLVSLLHPSINVAPAAAPAICSLQG